MGQATGDLSPRGSGTASLGVDMHNGMGGFTTDIRPYAHVHMNSGVWHDASTGQSGVLRFDHQQGIFEVSVDGGLTFAQVTTGPGGGTVTDLDSAYDGGNEIQQHERALSPGVDSIDIDLGQAPVVIKSVPGAGSREGSYSLALGREVGSIIASGHTSTPDLPNTFAYTNIGPGFLHMQASGISSEAPNSFVINMGNVGGITADLASFATDANMIFGGRGIQLTTESGESDGDIVFSAGDPTGGHGVGGSIILEPFGSSGALEYRFGPHQSWYMKQTHSSTSGPDGDGYNPLVASGAIIQMINEGIAGAESNSLQNAYTVNPYVFTTIGNEGAVKFNGNATNALSLFQATGGTGAARPHIIMSGIPGIPNANLERGSLWMQGHGAGWEANLNGGSVPLSIEEANARALGPALPMYHNGSGVTNIMVASGIGQFANASTTAIDPSDGLAMDTLVSNIGEDKYYTSVASSGVVCNVAGSYRIALDVTCLKTAGNLAQSVLSSFRVRDHFGQEFAWVGSESVIYLRDSDTHNFNTANNIFYADLDAGEALYFSLVLMPNVGEKVILDNAVSLFQTGAVMVLEYVGPKRFGKANRQKRA